MNAQIQYGANDADLTRGVHPIIPVARFDVLSQTVFSQMLMAHLLNVRAHISSQDLLTAIEPMNVEQHLIEAVEENSVSLTGRQASFRGEGTPHRKR